MANTIILKKSSTASSIPAAGSLQPGEVAVNLADQKLYSKTTGGTVIQVGFGNLTSGMVTTALGFTPYNATNPSGYTSNTGTVTGVTGTAPIVSSGGTAPAISISAATTSAAGSMSAADKTKLDGIASGATNYVLPKATATALGGVEVFSTTVQTTAANAVTTTASRTYGVQFDSSDRLVVNVPWTAGGTGTVTGVTGTAPIASSGGTAPAISISAATTSAAGSMSAADKTKLDGIASGATANTGTVTSVSVTTANGVSGTVATSTTTPAITLTLGAITPSSVVASGNVTAFSDERLKTNWRNVSEGFVSNLAGLKSGIYDRVDIAETQAGVGAQSLQKFLPEVVVEDQEGTLSVNYGAAAMISAVELAKELVLLRAELAALQLQLVAQQGSGE